MTGAMPMPLRELYAATDAWFRMRETRERWLLALMALALVGWVVDGVAIRPLDQERERVASAIRTSEQQIASLEARLEAIRNPVLDEPERLRRDEVRQLEQQIARIEESVRGAVARLVAPETAVAILEALLDHDDRLKMLALTSEAPRRLGGEGAPGTNGLYRHGITIEIQGDFAATLDYLRRIEDSDWEILWDRLDYRVERHPEARVRIELHTLSDMEEWVGV